MKLKTVYFLSIILFLFSCNKNSTEFNITGNIEGKNTNQLIFRYVNLNKKLVTDTVKIINNKFIIKGNIISPMYVSLRGNIKSKSISDPNLVYFFIEPGNNKVFLTENKFKDILIKGSKTQKEFELNNSVTESIYKRIRVLMTERRKIVKSSIDSFLKIKKIEEIDSLWRIKLDSITRIKLNYAWTNKSSYLSAFYINKFFKKISFDSTSLYINNLEQKVQKSYYGNKIINKNLERKPVNIGDKAPLIEEISLNNKVFKLNQLKGKVVLVDFWASWCKPCRKNSHSLKNIFKKYNIKGFEIISISLDEDENKWKEAVDKDNLNNWYNIRVGRNAKVLTQYNINEIPDYILIDKKGVIIARNLNQKLFTIIDLELKLDSIFKN